MRKAAPLRCPSTSGRMMMNTIVGMVLAIAVVGTLVAWPVPLPTHAQTPMASYAYTE